MEIAISKKTKNIDRDLKNVQNFEVRSHEECLSLLSLEYRHKNPSKPANLQNSDSDSNEEIKNIEQNN